MDARSAPQQMKSAFIAQRMCDAGMGEEDGLPRVRVITAELVWSGRSGTVAKGTATSLGGGQWREQEELGIFADAADTGSARRNLLEDGGVGIAAIESEPKRALGAAGILIQGLTELDHLLCGAETETGGMGVETELGANRGGSVGLGLRWGGSMEERDGNHAEGAIIGRHRGGDLKETLGADEVGLETRAERIAAPGDARSMETGATQECVIDDGAKGGVRGEMVEDPPADNGEDVDNGDALLREEPIGGGPIVELSTGSRE